MSFLTLKLTADGRAGKIKTFGNSLSGKECEIT